LRTLLLSDLHLGARGGADLLRRPEHLDRLLRGLREQQPDRVVLLGDVLELRQGPRRDAVAAAEPVFRALGEALPDGELIYVAGNHDHALIESWLAARGAVAVPPPLTLEERFGAVDAGPELQRLAAAAEPGRLACAYPGLWLRSDVYATHGHYLDCHLTVPSFERLSLAVMTRVLSRAFESPDDYEAVGEPIFAWLDGVAQRDAPFLRGGGSVAAWRMLGGGERSVRARALGLGFPVAVAALNRAGLGPLRSDLSRAAVRRAWLEAMGEVAARLGLGDAWVIFGHTHRAGPLESDVRADWIGRRGARLLNVGSWTSNGFASDGSPYSPSWVALVDDEGPPRLVTLG
jgi:predicted phosphodiesterase